MSGGWRRGDVLPIAVAVVLRAAVVAGAPAGLVGGDADAYVHVARFLRDHGTIPSERGLPGLMPPLLPLLLAVLSLGGDALGVVLLKVVNVLSGGVAVLLGRRLAERSGGPAAGRWAAWMLAVHPMLVLYARDVSTESLYVPMLLGTVVLCGALVDVPRASRAAGLGVLFGLSTLLRPVVAPWAPLVALAFLVASRNVPFSRRLFLCVVVGLTMTATILPWSVFVSRRFQEPILLTDTAGFNFWDGHHPLNRAAMDARAQDERDAIAARKDAERRVLVERWAAEGLSRRARSDAFFGEAWRHMDEGGASLAWHTRQNLWGMWKPWPDPVAHGLLRSVLLGAWLVPLTLLGLVGLAAALRTGAASPACAWASLLGILSVTVSAAAFVGAFRYRFGHVDPLLCVYAGCTLSRLRCALRPGDSPVLDVEPTGRSRETSETPTG